MIGRRCKASNGFSRPVLIARDLLSKPRLQPRYFSQVTYCGGYSGEDPPLPIPNREVKLTSADGTAPPGGRVGSCRFSEVPIEVTFSRGFFFCARGGACPKSTPSVSSTPARQYLSPFSRLKHSVQAMLSSFLAFAEFGTGEGLLRYGICAPCKKQAPGVRDAFSEAFGVKNRRFRYRMDIRYRKPPSLVRDRPTSENIRESVLQSNGEEKRGF